MIEVEVNLNLALRGGKKREKLDIGESISLPQLVERLGLNDGDVGMLLINKNWAPPDSIIKDGDLVQLYPFLEGG